MRFVRLSVRFCFQNNLHARRIGIMLFCHYAIDRRIIGVCVSIKRIKYRLQKIVNVAFFGMRRSHKKGAPFF